MNHTTLKILLINILLIKKRQIFLFGLIIFLISCKSEKPPKSFILNGVIKGDIPEYIYLDYGSVRDSARVTNNRFKFQGEVKIPVESSFSVLGISSMVDDFFYLENNLIDIEMTIDKKTIKNTEINFIKIDSIIGSETEDIRYDFNLFENKYTNDSIYNFKLYKKLQDIINRNPRNNYSGFLLSDQVSKGNLNKHQVLDLYKKVDTNVLSNRRLELLHAILYPERNIKTGKQIFDFQLPNSLGETINTKNYRGKVFLIDFWASWCVPCRKQVPELLNIYNEYKKSGFELLGVSLDTDKKKWLRAIKQDKLVWENVIDTTAFEGEIAVKYKISAIPTNLLVDENGILITKNITMNDLKIYLEILQKIEK